jgi:hypothetical protein
MNISVFPRRDKEIAAEFQPFSPQSAPAPSSSMLTQAASDIG